jgi:outer membrane protein OmpA-like peptidoglycan-associated protein
MFIQKALLIITIIILNLSIKAQYDGDLQFIGRTFWNNKPLKNTKIRVISNSKTISEFDTKNDNNFRTKIEFGNIYDVYFINANCQTMFIRIFANGVPEKKRYIKMAYALDIPFFTKDPTIFDTTQFTNPFHQIVFDGKSKFVDDTVYMNSFIRKIYAKKPIIKKDTVVPILTTEKIKEYLQLAGKLSIDNDKNTPLKNKTVKLINNKGEVISTSQTTNHGTFVFQHVDKNEADGITIALSIAENPNNDKIKLRNSAGDKIDVATVSADQTYTFKNNGEHQIINQLRDNDFNFNMAGKLVAVNGTDKIVASDKTVYLLNDKNTIISKTKTNVLGTFLFSNISPNCEYGIAYDSADAIPNYVMSLFTVKDKFVKRLDSMSRNKFVYKFISVTGSSFNDFIMDDSELKMNVNGRLYGNNKNNPLANMKVMLLNEKYEPIDSAMTNKDGDFTFKHLPYTKQLLISADNAKNILESFDNILVFDNADNLIKIVSQVKGQKFNYRPLETEQHRFTEIYVDDPWLSIIERENANKNKAGDVATIIENILFEFNKAGLLEESKQTLDKVILAMKSNEKFDIELSAHSDSKGSDAYNLNLSQQRAEASKLYIISKGINGNRIVAKGYGESKLLNNCGNGAICSDDEHAVNRRLEFKLNFTK